MADEAAAAAEAEAAAAAAAKAQAAEAAKVQRDAELAQIARMEAQLSALTDTVKSTLQARQMPTPSGKLEVPVHMRQLLRQGGLTDADIDANAPIVLPFLAALEGTSGANFQWQLQQMKDEVEMVKAARNAKKYPDWEAVADDVAELREREAKEGRYMSVNAAYHASVAANLDRVAERRAEQKRVAAERAADLSAQHVTDHGVGAGRQQARVTQPTSGADLAAMSREDRKKFFETHGDAIIR